MLERAGYGNEVVSTVIAGTTGGIDFESKSADTTARHLHASSVDDIVSKSRTISRQRDYSEHTGFGISSSANRENASRAFRATTAPAALHLHETKFLDVSVWLEAVDPKHRYSKSLKKYFCFWQQQQQENSQRQEDFFTWLDFGNGRSVDLPWCPRRVLESRRVKYMTPRERSYFEVVVSNGRLQWANTGKPCYTRRSRLQKTFGKRIIRSGTWIFVLSRNNRLYVGQKIKGRLHHSSFTAGAPTLASGNIHVSEDGILKSISPKSGHYRPKVSEWSAALIDFFTAAGIEDGGKSAFRL